jgi:hypothetical protein
VIEAAKDRMGFSLVELADGFAMPGAEGVAYGTKRTAQGREVYRSHAEQLGPAVKALGLLEEEAQTSFLGLQGLFSA